MCTNTHTTMNTITYTNTDTGKLTREAIDGDNLCEGSQRVTNLALESSESAVNSN